MQHHETQKRQPKFDDFGAEPLADSGVEDELSESEFDTEAAPEPGEEERR
jgi:hypothetical protein